MENINPMNQDFYEFDVPIVENFEDANVDDFKWFSKRNSIIIRPGNAFPNLTNEVGDENLQEENEIGKFIDDKKNMTPLGEISNMAVKEGGLEEDVVKEVQVMNEKLCMKDTANKLEAEGVSAERGEKAVPVIDEKLPVTHLKGGDTSVEKIIATEEPSEKAALDVMVTPVKKGKPVVSKANTALPHQKANLCRTELPKKAGRIAEEGWKMATGHKTKRLVMPKPGKLPDLPEEKENHEPAKPALARCHAFLEPKKMPRALPAQPRLNLPAKAQTLGRVKMVGATVGPTARSATLPKVATKPSTRPITPHLSTMNRAMAKLSRMDSASTASGSTVVPLHGNVPGALPKEAAVTKPKFVQPKWK